MPQHPSRNRRRPALVAAVALAAAACSDLAEPRPPVSPLERPVSPAEVAWIAANAHPLAAVTPRANEDFADLAPLGAAIGSARVVLLGEASHGDGATFLAKARLVQYLHQRLGFDVLVWESGMYEQHAAWGLIQEGADPVRAQRDANYYLWGESAQAMPVAHYVAAHADGARPLEIAGMDLQPSGALRRTHFRDDLEAYAERIGAPRDEGWATFVGRAAAHGRLPPTEDRDATPAAQQDYLARLDALRALSLERATAGDREALFWSQLLQSMRAQAVRLWGTEPGDAEHFRQRDAQMADNLIFLADRYYAGRKLIVWAATLHVAGELAPLKEPLTAQRPYVDIGHMGLALRRHFGNQKYAIGVTAYEGSVRVLDEGPALRLDPPVTGMLEDLVAHAGFHDAFLDLRGLPSTSWLREHRIARFLGHRPMEGNWVNVLDGAIFLRQMVPSTRSTP